MLLVLVVVVNYPKECYFMDLKKAISLVFGAAALLAGYSDAAAQSCYADDTLRMDNCPPGSGPSPGWPWGGWDGHGDNSQPIYWGRNWLVPNVSSNPHPSSCGTTGPLRISHARYEIASMVANHTYPGVNALHPDDTFIVKFNDGKVTWFRHNPLLSGATWDDIVLGYHIEPIPNKTCMAAQ
jgi:hypothetical protein